MHVADHPTTGVPDWVRIDDDLTLATREDTVIGYIDRRGRGHHLVFDQHGRYVDTFGTSRLARAALGDPSRPAIGSVWLADARRWVSAVITSTSLGASRVLREG